jgi:ComF family protein
MEHPGYPRDPIVPIDSIATIDPIVPIDPIAHLQRALQSGLNLLFPANCLFCRKVCAPVAEFSGICHKCLSQLPLRFGDGLVPWPSSPDGVAPGRPDARILCACYYESPIKDSLLQLKFSDASEWRDPLASLLVRTVKQSHQQFDGVIAVPLHPGRLRERGYNQAGLLAERVSRALAIPDLTPWLERSRQTQRQSEQAERSARWQNLAEAFVLRDPALFRRRRILLIDDILTTGATLTAAAWPLWHAGCSVTGLVVASNHRASQDFSSPGKIKKPP